MSEWRPISRPCDDGHTYVAVVVDSAQPDGYRYYTDESGQVVEFDATQAAMLKKGVHPDDIMQPPQPIPPIKLERTDATHSEPKKRGRPKKVSDGK